MHNLQSSHSQLISKRQFKQFHLYLWLSSPPKKLKCLYYLNSIHLFFANLQLKKHVRVFPQCRYLWGIADNLKPNPRNPLTLLSTQINKPLRKSKHIRLLSSLCDPTAHSHKKINGTNLYLLCKDISPLSLEAGMAPQQRLRVFLISLLSSSEWSKTRNATSHLRVYFNQCQFNIL